MRNQIKIIKKKNEINTRNEQTECMHHEMSLDDLNQHQSFVNDSTNINIR